MGIREWGRGGRANWDGMRELGGVKRESGCV